MSHRAALLLLPLVGCLYDPPPGTNIGALREPDPDPALPTDTTTLDMARVVEDALVLGGTATLAATWMGHVAALENGTSACPTVWVGPLPEGIDIDIDEDTPGLSWAADCTAAGSGASYGGFVHWSATLNGTEGARDLVADATVAAANGDVLYAFDGAATDAFDASSGQYASAFNGEISGSLVGLAGGVRTGAEFTASWGAGALALNGGLTVDGGWGPPDNRDPATSPELDDVSFTTGMPRFTSVVFDLEFRPDCPNEPYGYVGMRGNEGYWFDVYFLPKYTQEEDFSSATAFPYEEIDNVTCDGIGTLFARNVSLKAKDEELTDWSREITPDFGTVFAALPTPNLDAYVYTLRNLPLE